MPIPEGLAHRYLVRDESGAPYPLFRAPSVIQGPSNASVFEFEDRLLNGSPGIGPIPPEGAVGAAACPGGSSGAGHGTAQHQSTMLLCGQVRLCRFTVENGHAGGATVGTGHAVFI